jgi:type II secretory pathway component PulF
MLVLGAMNRVVPLSNEASRSGSERSQVVRLAIRSTGAIAGLSLVALCLGPLSFVLFTLAVLFAFIGWFPRDLPLIWRVFRRYDGALVMRGMALAVRRNVPIPQALTLLKETYPLQQIALQLERAGERVTQGQDWCDSLRRTGLIGQADVAILSAAQRAGNLDWALEEMADSALRRQTHKLQTLIQLLFPVILLLLGGLVFFIVVGLFLPLISLIEGLT